MNDIDSVRSSELLPNNLVDNRCAPTKEFANGSCMELDALIELTKAYNEEANENGKEKIQMIPKLNTLNPQKYKRYLVKSLKNRLSDICDNQHCWIKQPFVNRIKREIRHQLRNYTLRPVGPQGKFTWLNTFNINDVMLQYEEKYKDFKFLGAVPIDFDDIPAYGIRDMDLDKLYNEGIHRLGIVFNLDEHDQSGSHWVSGYADIKNGQIYFSDSYGTRPEPRIRKFMRRIARYYKEKNGRDPVVKHNEKQHQYENSECGVYSINMIIRLLNGETFEDIHRTRISDKNVNKCRDKYFIKVNESR